MLDPSGWNSPANPFDATQPRPRALRSRREILQIGQASLLSLLAPRWVLNSAGGSEPSVRAPETKSAAGIPRAKGVLFIFLTGGPSHIDTFDMKPDAPAEVRGEFSTLTTKVPGLLVCEHLPRLAERVDKLAVIRTMNCSPALGAHETGTHAILTGINTLPSGAGLYASRNDWPCFAAGLDAVRPSGGNLPSGLNVPHMRLMGSPYCGQSAGFLGSRHDPWTLARNPNDAKFAGDDSLGFPAGLSVEQFSDRRALLQSIDRQRADLEAHASVGQFTEQQAKACDSLLSGQLARALALGDEKPETRDRYGRHLFGQSLLLARRVLEAGVPMVQANMGVAGQWDTHSNNCTGLKKNLLPPLDQAVSALLDDMTASGLLDDYLVVMTGEFGRTPKLGGNVGSPMFSPDGRDHWTQCFWSILAGRGVHGGRTIGRSDGIGAFPATDAYAPADLGATVYEALGVDRSTQIHDRLGRPLTLNEGTPISAVFSGVEA